MTNTKFRKRALLSSVAMLLVALVALGSATFAWFTQTPRAFADGFSAKTTVNPSLRVQTTSDSALNTNARGFQTTTYFNAKSGGGSKGDVSLEPASWKGTFNSSTKAPDYLKATAASDSASDLDTAKAITADPAVWTERVYFQTASGIQKGQANQTAAPVYLRKIEWTVNSTVTGTETAMADEIYCIISKSDGTVIGQYGKTGSQSYLKATKTATAEWKESTYKGTRTTTIAQGTFSGNDAPNVATAYFKDKAKITYNSSAASFYTSETDLDYVTVSFYLDGEADDVFTNNVRGVNVGALIQDFKLTFDLDKDSSIS